MVFSPSGGQGSAERQFFSPFDGPGRGNFSSIKSRLIGLYGEYRRSYKPGHLHAGIDLEGPFNEKIYAIGHGLVQRVFREFPHKSVIVKHDMPDGNHLFSVYTHVEDIEVDAGDRVNPNTPLARLFSEDELIKADFGTPNHLHMEIRKSIADGGRASYASLTMDELNEFCVDPMDFFRIYLEDKIGLRHVFVVILSHIGIIF